MIKHKVLSFFKVAKILLMDSVSVLPWRCISSIQAEISCFNSCKPFLQRIFVNHLGHGESQFGSTQNWYCITFQINFRYFWKLLFMSSQKSCCVYVYSRSNNEAQAWFRKGLSFWHLIVDISCKQCPIREVASRLFLIIAFVSPLSCSKLSVTWTRTTAAFWIFSCRFLKCKLAFWWVLLSCENNSYIYEQNR